LILEADHVVLTAARGRQALDLLRRRHVDLVVLDLKLPDISGKEVLRQIRAAHPAVPVIVLTVLDRARTAWETQELGAYAYFTKPFDEDDLRACIREALSGKAPRATARRAGRTAAPQARDRHQHVPGGRCPASPGAPQGRERAPPPGLPRPVAGADRGAARAAPRAPTITSFSATVANSGTAVTITGTNFDPVFANDKAKFNLGSAQVTAATATTITATVPASGTSGRVTVTTPVGSVVSTPDFFIPARRPTSRRPT
jgi:CheY-like chemotaxis protein